MSLLQYFSNKKIRNLPDENNLKTKYPETNPPDIVKLIVSNQILLFEPIKPIIWIYKNTLVIYFPSPHKFIPDTEEDQISEQIIHYTNKKIQSMMEKKPTNIILDLRSNRGGSFNIFYESLISILPDCKNKDIISGWNPKYGKVACFKNVNNKKLVLAIREPNGFNFNSKVESDLRYKHQYKLPTKVLLNSNSSSSSQAIALVYYRDPDYGRQCIIGNAPTIYTNGTILSLYYKKIFVFYPYYNFQDENGDTPRGILTK